GYGHYRGYYGGVGYYQGSGYETTLDDGPNCRSEFTHFDDINYRILNSQTTTSTTYDHSLPDLGMGQGLYGVTPTVGPLLPAQPINTQRDQFLAAVGPQSDWAKDGTAAVNIVIEPTHAIEQSNAWSGLETTAFTDLPQTPENIKQQLTDVCGPAP